MRLIATLLLLVWHVDCEGAGDAGCIDLTRLDRADLEKYTFTIGRDEAAMRLVDRRRDYVAGEVRVVIQPIFDPSDPAEDRWLYRWANRLHVRTHEDVIRAAILFRTGDPVRVSTMLESERILRAKSYLYDARVIPRRLCGDRLDVDVVARDVWTLYPDVEFSRSGGDNSYQYGVVDTSVLGSGQTLELFRMKDQDRDGSGVLYQNPNVRGSRVAFDATLAEYSDGSRRVVEVAQPFYSLDTRREFDIRLEDTDIEQGLYQFNDKFAEFRQKLRQANVEAGTSNGDVGGQAWRWIAGFKFEEHKFSRVPVSVPPSPFPTDRTYAYPWIGFASAQDRYDTTVDVDRIHRTEDLDLGRDYAMLLGWSDGTFGGDDADRLVLKADYSDGLRFDHRNLIFYGADFSGYWNFATDRSEELKANAHVSYRQQQAGHFSVAATLRGAWVHNLPNDEQLLGGGDTGLRGYPSRYQWGNRSVLASIEERYFSDIYIARIVRLGFAAFVDAGRTWFAGAPDGHGYGALVDVGVGLRLESTRTRRDRVLHIDLAFPLVDGPDVSTVEILFVIKESL